LLVRIDFFVSPCFTAEYAVDRFARTCEAPRVKIYTKTGDDGTTGLFGGARVKKASARVEAYA